MALELTGTVTEVGDFQQVSEKFSKRTLLIETTDKYPQKVQFVFVNDKTKLLEDLPNGTEVTVSFNVRGNEYKGKHYVELTGWKLEPAEETDSETKTEEVKQDNSEDLPF